MKKVFTLVALAVMAFAAQANVLSVCQDTWYSGVYPVYGLWYDTPGESQTIYPADMLTEMAGGQITELSFLTLGTIGNSEYGDFSSYTIKFSGGEIQLALKEVDQLGFEQEAFITGAQVVANTVPVYDALTLDFVLDQPYQYNGGNLLVEVTVITEGSYGTTYFLGSAMVDENDNDIYTPSYYENMGYSGDLYSSGRSSFLPAIDFTYEPGQVTPPVDPTEKTGAPTFNGYTEDGIYAYFVEINETEPSTIYYRVIYPDGTVSEWAEYTEMLSFNSEGKYRVEAYAVAPGKLPSDEIAYEFVLSKMTGVLEVVGDKQVAGVRYFNLAGQEMTEANGLTIVVTTYTDGTTSAVKVMK